MKAMNNKYLVIDLSLEIPKISLLFLFDWKTALKYNLLIYNILLIY